MALHGGGAAVAFSPAFPYKIFLMERSFGSYNNDLRLLKKAIYIIHCLLYLSTD